MKEELEKRQAQLLGALDQSAANHNSLMGRLQEVKDLLSKLDSGESVAEVAPE